MRVHFWQKPYETWSIPTINTVDFILSLWIFKCHKIKEMLKFLK